MGGDTEELRYDFESQQCGSMRQTLNDAAKYAWILKQHLAAGGCLEEL